METIAKQNNRAQEKPRSKGKSKTKADLSRSEKSAAHNVSLKLGRTDALDSEGFSLLHRAAEAGDLNMLQGLLALKGDLEVRDKTWGNTPLFRAVLADQLAAAALLLASKSLVDATNKDAVSPLYQACATGSLKMIELLVKEKADVNFPSSYNQTPLQAACLNGHTSAVQFLLEHGSNVNAITKSGVCALYMSAERGHTEIIRLLVNAHANVDMASSDGVTPLMRAAYKGQLNACKTLIELKATVDLTFKNKSAATWAKQEGHVEVFDFLNNLSQQFNHTTTTSVGAPELKQFLQELKLDELFTQLQTVGFEKLLSLTESEWMALAQQLHIKIGASFVLKKQLQLYRKNQRGQPLGYTGLQSAVIITAIYIIGERLQHALDCAKELARRFLPSDYVDAVLDTNHHHPELQRPDKTPQLLPFNNPAIPSQGLPSSNPVIPSQGLPFKNPAVPSQRLPITSYQTEMRTVAAEGIMQHCEHFPLVALVDNAKSKGSPTTVKPPTLVPIIDSRSLDLPSLFFAQGNQGDLFLITWQHPGALSSQPFVFKRPRNPSHSKSLEEESNVWCKIPPHPNVCPLAAVVRDPTGKFEGVIMPHYPLGSSDRIKLFRLHPTDLVNALRGLAQGLVHLHSIGLVHRDLAPRNVLVSADKKFILSDFGMSHFGESPLKETEQLPWRNLAPEILIARQKLSLSASSRNQATTTKPSIIFTPSTDMWAFGVLLWELACAQEPYAAFGSDMRLIQTGIADGSINLPMEEVCLAYPVLAPVLLGCLERDPQRRLNAREVLLLLGGDVN